MIHLEWRPKLLLMAQTLKHRQNDSAFYGTTVTLEGNVDNCFARLTN